MIHPTERDGRVIASVDERTVNERLSRSAVILSIPENQLVAGSRLGEILEDLEAPLDAGPAGPVEPQSSDLAGRRLGGVLVSESRIDAQTIERSLAVQGRFSKQYMPV